MFTTGFADYVCIEDSIECELDGLIYTARLEFDWVTKPTDYDCYSAEQLEAWKRDDDWFFGGIVISARAEGGVWRHNHCTSLWGLECNMGDSNAYLLEVANELLPEAQSTALSSLKALIAKVAS